MHVCLCYTWLFYRVSFEFSFLFVFFPQIIKHIQENPSIYECYWIFRNETMGLSAGQSDWDVERVVGEGQRYLFLRHETIGLGSVLAALFPRHSTISTQWPVGNHSRSSCTMEPVSCNFVCSDFSFDLVLILKLIAFTLTIFVWVSKRTEFSTQILEFKIISNWLRHYSIAQSVSAHIIHRLYWIHQCVKAVVFLILLRLAWWLMSLFI